MERLVIRAARSAGGKVGYVVDLIDSREGFPVYPIVPFVLTSDELETDVIMATYLRNHPTTQIEMGR